MSSTSSTTRRRWAVVGAAAATAAVVALTVGLAAGGSDTVLAAGSSGSPSAGTAPGELPPPEVTAKAGYRQVSFALTGVDGVSFEANRGEDWEPVEGTVAYPTDRGGRRVCADFRAVDGDGASAAIRSCGVASPSTIELVSRRGTCRLDDGERRDCRFYGVEVAGFPAGTAPEVRIEPVGATAWCDDRDLAASYCQRVTVGDNGRGRIKNYFRWVDGAASALVRVEVDGVTTEPLVLCGPSCADGG